VRAPRRGQRTVSGRRGKLGRNQLRNALHLLREGAATDEEKAAMNELLVAAGLGFSAVMAALLLTL
jgi:hypothetical protein